jgi:hypothetical protein
VFVGRALTCLSCVVDPVFFASLAQALGACFLGVEIRAEGRPVFATSPGGGVGVVDDVEIVASGQVSSRNVCFTWMANFSFSLQYIVVEL